MLINREMVEINELINNNIDKIIDTKIMIELNNIDKIVDIKIMIELNKLVNNNIDKFIDTQIIIIKLNNNENN